MLVNTRTHRRRRRRKRKRIHAHTDIIIYIVVLRIIYIAIRFYILYISKGLCLAREGGKGGGVVVSCWGHVEAMLASFEGMAQNSQNVL